MTSLLFFILSLILIFSAISLIVVKNPIHSVLYLIVVFVGTSGLLIMCDAEFLSMIFIIIYVGAISVLFLFIIMMLNIKMIELRENLLKYIPISFVIGLTLLAELIYLFKYNFNLNLHFDLNSNLHFTNFIDYFTIFNSSDNIKLLGYLIFTSYVDYFLICGLILFVSMIGTILLTLHLEISTRKQDLYLQVGRDFKVTVKNVNLV